MNNQPDRLPELPRVNRAPNGAELRLGERGKDGNYVATLKLHNLCKDSDGVELIYSAFERLLDALAQKEQVILLLREAMQTAKARATNAETALDLALTEQEASRG